MDSVEQIPTPNSSVGKTESVVRGKTDPSWAYCKEVLSDNKKRRSLICMFCDKVFKGGGIHRFKQHPSMKSDVAHCIKVSAQTRYEMTKLLENISAKKRSASYGQSNFRDNEEQLYMKNDFVQEIEPTHASTSAKGKKVAHPPKKRKTIDTMFMPRTTPGGQPSLKSVLQTKATKEKVDMVVSKWMIDASISFNASNSAYFQEMFDAVSSFGPGYKAPTYHDLRGFLLRKNVEQVKNYVDSFRTTWKRTGCTVMADGWSDRNRRTLINLLVYCPRGTVFLKSVDALDASKTDELLFNLFKDVLLDVGVDNVVHIVTDNASNFVADGRLLEREFPSLFWSPCDAHCLNLMFQYIGKLDEVKELVVHASKITRYIYNHGYALYLMRKHTGGREILRPDATRFATNFIALQSVLTHKDSLRAMVTSKDWKT